MSLDVRSAAPPLRVAPSHASRSTFRHDVACPSPLMSAERMAFTSGALDHAGGRVVQGRWTA